MKKLTLFSILFTFLLGHFCQAMTVENFELWVPEKSEISLPDLKNTDLHKQKAMKVHQEWQSLKSSQVQASSYKFGRYINEYWVKVTLPSQKMDHMLVLGSERVELAELYHFRNGEFFEVSFGGLRAGAVGVNLISSVPVFFIKNTDVAGTDELYLRVVSLGAKDVQLDLQPYKKILEDMEISRALIYFFLGAVLMLSVYLLVVYTGVREKSILYYIGFTFSFSMMVLVNTGIIDYFSSDNSNFQFSYLGPLFTTSIILFAILFTGSFLELQGTPKKILKLALVLPALGYILALIFATDPYDGWTPLRPLPTLIHAGSTLILIGMVIWAAIQRYPYSRLVLASWLPLASFVLMEIFRLLPFGKAYGSQLIIIPLLGEMLMMSFAMASKARTLSRKASELNFTQQQNDLLKQVLRAVSHDLANYFFIISSNTELIQRKFKDPEILNRVTRIQGALSRANGVIASVRSWMLAKDDRLSFQLNPVSAKKIVKEAISNFEEKSAAKDIAILLLWPESMDNEKILADESALLNQVLSNTISNAIKFTPRNDEIEIIGARVGDDFVITIKDHGKGMPPEMVQKINRGEPIDSSPGTENEKGTGFGMSLMYSYMTAFGGSLKVFSSMEEGRSGTEVNLFFKSHSVDQQITRELKAKP